MSLLVRLAPLGARQINDGCEIFLLFMENCFEKDSSFF